MADEIVDGDGVARDFSGVRVNPGTSGDHRDEGMIVLHGPSVLPGPLAGPVSLYQIAPTVLYLLGLPQDSRMLAHAPTDGGVLTDAIRPEVLERQPPRMVATYAGAEWTDGRRDASGGGGAVDPDELERLRTLGYVQ